jgi:type II secretory pathway component PulJ
VNRERLMKTRCLRRSRGLGVVELLVVLAIAGIIMVVVAAFFSFQSRVSRDTQARNEIHIRARAAAEAVVQDLRLAGARALVDSTGRAAFLPDGVLPSDCQSQARCVSVVLNAQGELQSITVWYASSLFLPGNLSDDGAAEQACRRIEYRLSPTAVEGDPRILYRSDVTCDDAATGADVETFENEFVDGIAVLDIEFWCGDDVTVPVSDPGECFADEIDQGVRYVREARVDITAVSDRRQDLEEQVSLSVTLVNMRSPTRFGE